MACDGQELGSWQGHWRAGATEQGVSEGQRQASTLLRDAQRSGWHR